MNVSQRICSLAAAAAVSTLTLSITASADPLPSYAVSGGATIHGKISSITGKYDVDVRDDRGYVDHVVLHDGTVINPTGFELGAGQTVTVDGRNDGRVFLADEVDTPYSNDDQSNNYYGPGDDSQGYSFNQNGYGSPYGFGYPGYPGFSGLYFGGGYYGRGYSARGYSGRDSFRGESQQRGSYGGANVGRSYGRGGTNGHTGSSGAARGGPGGGSAHH